MTYPALKYWSWGQIYRIGTVSVSWENTGRFSTGLDLVPWIFHFFLSVPGKPPTNVTAKSKTSTAIEVTWLCIDCQQHNFTVVFLVSYKPNSNNQTVGRSVNRTVRELLITGLKKYTNYTIYVTSITIWGQGLSNERLSIRTQEDGKCRETYGLPLNSVKRKLVGLFFLRTPSGQVLCDTGGTAI